MAHSLAGVDARILTVRRAVVSSLAGAALTAACAQVAFYLPGNPVPVTMQVFAVVLCGMLLGSRSGLMSQLCYLAAGAAGLPVFAGFRGGIGALCGPTAGYVFAFAAAAFLIGWICERSARSYSTSVLAGITGLAAIYLIGRLWLAIWLGSLSGLTSWALGVAPFVGLDIVKVLVAAAICSHNSLSLK